MKVDERVAGQLLQIKNMEYVMTWLSGRLEDTKGDLMYLSGEALLRAQGRAVELKELLGEIQRSQNTLKRHGK
jgi:hypothetical protein